MMQTVTLHPSRIGCPSLPGTMKGIVSSLKGIKEVNVRYAERSLDVTFDDAIISPQEIIQAIGKELGLHMEIGKTHGSKKGNVANTCPM